MEEHFFIYNNNFFQVSEPVISAGNRSLMYGDGLFETMRMNEGRILNVDFHFERFINGLRLLQFDLPGYFSSNFFIEKIMDLLLKNVHGENARIRLMAFRGKGSIFNPENNSPNYILETWALPQKIELNETGLAIGVFSDGAKSCDQFSNLKSNNYLLSVMAGLFAKNNNLDDCLLLNSFGRVCESAIANVYIIKNENIYTPPLSEGCVAGVMRRWMLEKFSFKNYKVIGKSISIREVIDADEIFLTNSVQPIRWVKYFRERNYPNQKIKEIAEYLFQKI